MAKELPYFRFTASEWLNGDISLEDYRTKGVFIDVCAYYWFKDCSTTKAMLEKRFKDAKDVIGLLIDECIIDWNDETDYIQINFLNEQFDILSEKRKARQAAGSKGGKRKSSNAKAKLKQKPSYKDKDKDKYKDKDKNIPTYEDFNSFAVEKKADVNKEALKLKYESWVENGWKDGNNKKIINWKAKLLNTLPYIKETSGQKDTGRKIENDITDFNFNG